jgi:hypothetical protein
VLKERELMKAKATANYQTKKQMCDSFVCTIRGLRGSDLVSQALVELNGPLHSNWVGLL